MLYFLTDIHVWMYLVLITPYAWIDTHIQTKNIRVYGVNLLHFMFSIYGYKLFKTLHIILIYKMQSTINTTNYMNQIKIRIHLW